MRSRAGSGLSEAKDWRGCCARDNRDKGTVAVDRFVKQPFSLFAML